MGEPNEQSVSSQTGQYLLTTSEYLLLIGERWVHKLPVEDTGALGVRGEQPNHKCNFQLEIKGKPERKMEEKKERDRERWRTGIKISTETDGDNW